MIPNATILKVDIDHKPLNRRAFDHRVVMLAKTLGAPWARVTIHATRKGSHATITLLQTRLAPGEIIASQLYLGSDPARELFNLGRVTHGETKGWNVLFCAKWKHGAQISKENRPRSYSLQIGGGKQCPQTRN